MGRIALPEVTTTPPVGQTVPNPRRRSHMTSLNGVQYQYPVCDRCNRDVAAFTWADHFEHDGDRDGTTPMRTFFAACHGEIDSTTVTQSELRSVEKATDFRIERAFVKALPAPDDEGSPQFPVRAVARLEQ